MYEKYYELDVSVRGKTKTLQLTIDMEIVSGSALSIKDFGAYVLHLKSKFKDVLIGERISKYKYVG